MEESKKYKSYLKGTADIISPVDVKQVIVLDIGATSIRVGISGDNNPIIVLPLVIGRSKNKDSTDLTQTKLPDAYGKKALSIYKYKPQEYNLIYPIIDIEEINQKISELEPFLKYVFEELLHLECNQVELLIVDCLNYGSQFRISLMELCFENLRIQSVNFVSSAVASLFLSGRSTGCSLEFNHQSTNIVQIYEGFILKHALFTSKYGGNNATKVFEEYFESQNIDFQALGRDKFQMIQKIKNKISSISLNYEKDILEDNIIDTEEKCFELPDGKILTIDNLTKYKSGEVLLKPNMMIPDEIDIVSKVQESITKCEFSLQKILAQNILLSGGVSQTENMQERLQRDICLAEDPDLYQLNFKIYKETHSPFSSWIGGSLLGSIQTYQNMKIKKTDFEESSDSRLNFLFKRTIIQLKYMLIINRFNQLNIFSRTLSLTSIFYQPFQNLDELSNLSLYKSLIEVTKDHNFLSHLQQNLLLVNSGGLIMKFVQIINPYHHQKQQQPFLGLLYPSII